jgi:soluble lytic murein transglycosylase
MMRSWDTELRELNQGMLPDSMLGWYFPAPYHADISNAVIGLSVEPHWIEGIARDESYFNRFARSSVGATGLIQLMPGTAGDVSRWSGLPRLSGDDFFVPEYSLRYGSIYVNRQMNSFGHSPLFLAAYNAGPGNASRWVNTHGWDPADPELFIEQITFRETRLYVKNVQRSVWIYERIRR